jgi:hypothetical protein
MKIKVRNLTSSRGNKVANQFEIEAGNKTYFQSYETIIACYDQKGLILDTHALDYSRTTSKYLYEFTRSDRKELQERIKNKSIRVRNLNK